MVCATGRVLGTVTLGAPLPDGTPGLTLTPSGPGALLAARRQPQGVEVRYGARVVGVEETAERVEVELEDGTRVGRRPARGGRRRALAGRGGSSTRRPRPGATSGSPTSAASPGVRRWPPSWPGRARGTSSSAGARSSAPTRHPTATWSGSSTSRARRSTPTSGPRTSAEQWQQLAGRPARRTTSGRPRSWSRPVSSSWPATAPTTSATCRSGTGAGWSLIGDAAHAPSPELGPGGVDGARGRRRAGPLPA